MTGQPTERAPNQRLRAARLARSMSQDDLVTALRDAGWHGCDRRTLQRYESGEIRRPQYLARRALSAVLGLPWDQLGFDERSDMPSPAQESGAGPVEGDDDVRRRTFALTLAAAGLAAVAPPPDIEQLRHQLTGAGGSTALVGEWEALRDEHAVRIVRLPPALVLPALLADLTHLNQALTALDGPASAALYRIGAQLTTIAAWTLGNLDREADAVRWWRTSHQLALRSGDLDTRLWVTAQELLMALYQSNMPISVTRERIAAAIPLAHALPASAAVAKLYCAQAQAAAMASDAASAGRALRSVKDTFSKLPAAISSDRGSFLGWPETRIDYTESFTYAHLGDYTAASTAQDRAVAGFPTSSVREPVKVELQRALCLASTGATADAEHHALAQLSRLERSQHDLTISNLTRKVLRALPPGRVSDGTDQLETYLAAQPMET